MLKKIDAILYEVLTQKNILAKDALAALLSEIDASGQGLAALLLKHRLISEGEILNLLAEKLKLSFISLREITIDRPAIEKVPVKVATYYKFMPVRLKDRTLTIAVNSPLDIKTEDEIRMQLGLDIELALCRQDEIQEAIRKYYGSAAETLQNLERPLADASGEKIEDIEKLAGDASVIKLVNQVLLEAFRKRATDIHIEPYRERVSVRYRVDGLLYDANVGAEVDKFLSAIISRIKIMSNLNIVERRIPQDGRAVVRVQEHTLDLRISTIPTPFGESVVIRILPTSMLFSLEKLGLVKKELQTFADLIQKPHGIVFVTGPTGSGKTTTLYACLSRINTRERKIITIEDPIEYEMSGITQIQVMPEIGLTFAVGLRSILRHDPDVIMVGEVRDLETAQIAIRVALTGHLVFSTLHTNDAASSITRLVDIGVEPYLIASSVEAFIAQRLIRVICHDCRFEDKNAPRELKEMIAKDLELSSPDEVKIFRGKGCPNCNHTGFFGRTAIYEILVADDQIKNLILRKASSNEVKKVLAAKGMRTLRFNGWQKVTTGITTPEEVMKITSVEEYAVGPQEIENRGFSGDSMREGQDETADNRVYPRLDSKINLRYRLIKTDEELNKRGFAPEQLSVTKNISASGILFVADEPLLVGAVLELKLELPDNEGVIECLARVARTEENFRGKNYEVAVYFLDITGAQRSKLSKYIKKAL